MRSFFDYFQLMTSSDSKVISPKHFFFPEGFPSAQKVSISAELVASPRDLALILFFSSHMGHWKEACDHFPRILSSWRHQIKKVWPQNHFSGLSRELGWETWLFDLTIKTPQVLRRGGVFFKRQPWSQRCVSARFWSGEAGRQKRKNGKIDLYKPILGGPTES